VGFELVADVFEDEVFFEDAFTRRSVGDADVEEAFADFDVEQAEDRFAAQPEKAVERHVGVERVPEQAGGLEFG